MATILWLLFKLGLMTLVGYFISLGIKTHSQTKATEQLENLYKQELEANKYEEFQSEIELISKIRGLQVQSQKLIPNIKPKFYYNLNNATTKREIIEFLESLPDNFAACVPALKISIEDSRLKDIYFYKLAEGFQLGYKERDVIMPLGTIGLMDLAEKIVVESSTYTFQNVSVESIRFSS